MSNLVARTGRHQQLYDGGCRLIAGCIPYRYKDSDESSDKNSERIVEVLMINSSSGPGLLFPKGGWEIDESVEEAAVREAIEEAGVRGELKDCLGVYEFKSKTHQDESCPEGLCKASMYALLVMEELELWPEQSTISFPCLTGYYTNKEREWKKKCFKPKERYGNSCSDLQTPWH